MEQQALGIQLQALLLQLLAGVWLGAGILLIARHLRDKAAAASRKEGQQRRIRRSQSVEGCFGEASRKPLGEDEAEWLDRLAEVLWPRVSTWLENLVRNQIQPSIAKAMPSMLQSQITFREVTLGDSTPDFGPLTVTETDRNGIAMRLGFKMITDMRVGMIVMGMYVGVSKLHITGELSFIFWPPKKRPPFFGGLEVYFANPPTVDLEFHGIARLAECPGIRQTVRATITNAIARAMVLPNRIAVDLDREDDTDVVDMQSPDPLSILRLTLLRAENLVASDVAFWGESSSDPYVVVSLGGTSWTSPVVKRNLNPVWGEDGKGITLDFMVYSQEQLVKFEVYDEDVAKVDDLIGTSKGISLSSIQAGRLKVPLAYEAEGRTMNGGRLLVAGHLLELTTERHAACQAGPSVAFLSARVMEVIGLPSSSRSPFKVRLAVGEAETFSQASSAKVTEPVAQVLQKLCGSLLNKGYDSKTVANILHTGEEQVESLRSMTDLKEDMEAASARRASTNPQFNQRLQLLVPKNAAVASSSSSPGTPTDGSVELQLLDRKGEVLGSAQVSIAELAAADNLELHKQLRLEPVGGLLYVQLRLRWLRELRTSSDRHR